MATYAALQFFSWTQCSYSNAVFYLSGKTIIYLDVSVSIRHIHKKSDEGLIKVLDDDGDDAGPKLKADY